MGMELGRMRVIGRLGLRLSLGLGRYVVGLVLVTVVGYRSKVRPKDCELQ